MHIVLVRLVSILFYIDILSDKAQFVLFFILDIFFFRPYFARKQVTCIHLFTWLCYAVSVAFYACQLVQLMDMKTFEYQYWYCERNIVVNETVAYTKFCHFSLVIRLNMNFWISMMYLIRSIFGSERCIEHWRLNNVHGKCILVVH